MNKDNPVFWSSVHKLLQITRHNTPM